MVTARSEAWVCGRLLAGMAGLNPAVDMNVLSLVSVVCCQIEVSATGQSPVQSIPTECGASLCVINYNNIPLCLQWVERRGQNKRERKKKERKKKERNNKQKYEFNCSAVFCFELCSCLHMIFHCLFMFVLAL